ncbi:DNA cytosine methyltransferase [Microbacterium gilvum]|uniref:DNA (cytosine-5-)-methyltransferase n=1 Tax=Microbacterium gilvum TaxID=1336204 RepID=A0ABP8ZPS0_9MICO
MSAPCSGELFAGVGGLGMAVDEVFGTRPAWFCEFDDAPSRVLAHHHPDVPNFGDVTKVDWATAPRVRVMSGGFPCQDVSLAGRRRGMVASTRSGLWSEFAKAIDIMRPDWVVIENVRGLLSAEAHSDVEPCPWCLGDDGEQHALRALGAVLGDLADLGFDAEWTGIRASDVGGPHGRFRVFILAWPRERTAADAVRESVRGRARGIPRAAGEVERHGDQRERSGRASRDSGTHAPVALLPTPDAYAAGRGGSQHPDKRRDGGHTVSLADVTEHTLMPTPRATRGGSSTEMSYAMGGTRSDDERPQGVVAPGADWGPYAAAVARWETVLGRPAPAPVRMDGKGGKARLNPELPEWMMGWPAGHVTDPAIGLPRAAQLKCAGNGVVPQQAAAAILEMLARPGVPSIEWALAA